MQIFHYNAIKNIHIRQQIQSNSSIYVKDLAEKHYTSIQTVFKCKHRASLKQASCAPANINYAF